MGLCNSLAEVYLVLALIMLVGVRTSSAVENEGPAEVCDIGEDPCLDNQCCSSEKCVLGKECCEDDELPEEGSGHLWPDKCSRCSHQKCITTPTCLETWWVIVVMVVAILAVIAVLSLG